MNRTALWITAGVVTVLLAGIVFIALLPSKPPAAPAASASIVKVSSQDEKKAREEIRQVQARFKKAASEKDLKTVLSLMTEDFVKVPLQGSNFNKRQAEKAMKEAWPHVKRIDRWDLELVDFRLEGDKAVGIVREKLVARIEGTDGVVRTQDTTTQSRNTWIRTASGWKYQRMVDQPVGEGALGEADFIPRDRWARETQESQTAASRQASRAGDRAIADTDARPLTQSQARAMLTKKYAEFREAVRKKNVKASLASLTDDYVVEFPDHDERRLGLEAKVKREFDATVSIPEWTQSISDIKIDGNVITATIDEKKTVVMKVMTRDRKIEQKRGTMIVKMRDTWVKPKRATDWKNRRTEVLSQTQILDGKTRKLF